jgi:outer membrane protein OmpA-like peptidoglycan-associated protein
LKQGPTETARGSQFSDKRGCGLRETSGGAADSNKEATMRKILTVILVAAMVLGLFGCASMNRRDLGVLIGGAGGAAVGAVIGDATGNTAAGAIIGAAVGGTAGGIIGNYMDKQAEEMERDLEGAKIERVGEGIKITFGSGILFDVDESNLKVEAQENINQLATILNKYDDTNIILAGHTDSDGAEDYNLSLSERRTRSVASYLAQSSVASSRVTVTWHGESQPVEDNATAEGKQANRRVEVAVMANEELKKAAEQQAAEQEG